MVVFDWAGTTVDFGCFAPVRPFVETLAHKGIDISARQARGPMGLSKRDHLEALFELPEVTAQWRLRYGRDWTEADVNSLFAEHFMPFQLELVTQCSGLVPGLLECMAELRARDIKVGTSTGYFREAADLAITAAQRQGYQPDHNTCPADVPAGRPAPWMIYRNMEELGVFPPSAVVKVGDTLPDVCEGLNAGAWVIGVTDSSSEIGLSEADWAALPGDERNKKVAAWTRKLLEAGAHDVIPTIAELPAALDRLETRMRNGDKP